MSVTYKAFANAKALAVSNAEVIVSTLGTIGASGLSVGDAVRIKVLGTLDPTQQVVFNLRYGANGNVGDQAIFSSTNIVPLATLQSDLNSWAAANPGFTPNEYTFPAVGTNQPSIPNTPVKLDGELVVVVTATGAPANTANVSVYATGGAGLVGEFGSGLLVSNVVITSYNVASNVFVSMSAVGKGSYNWAGVGGGDASTPGTSWHYTQAANSGASQVTFSLIELI